MSEPSRRSSRLALVGGLGAALLCAGVGFSLGRSTAPAPPAPAPAPAPQVLATPTPTPSPIAAPSVLTRADLIMAARAAIDRMAGGEDAGPRMAALEGRRFEVRLPFGCAGPVDDERVPLRWRYDAKSGTLRISAAPVEWAPADWIAAEAQADVERIEGFWIKRPWTSSEACPAQAAAEQPETLAPAPETLGLATIASATSSRVGRRPGEPFASVKKIAQDQVDASRGFRLRLTGRVASAPGGGPITCRALGGPDRRPTCLIAVSLDEAAVENGATGDVLATWTVSRQPVENSAVERRTRAVE